MSPKYDKSVEVTREEEGSYHRVEVENTPGRTYSTTDYQVIKSPSSKSGHRKELVTAGYTSDEDNFEEWTTSKRKVNHTTRQVETRVSRQLLVEDGKVIADSGPQVTTRIKEDNKVEECEKEKTPKNKSKFDAIECAPEVGESTGRVLGEKKEIQKVSREVREENMQYHDERFKELTGHDVHRRAIQAPHELITITDKHSHSQPPRGKMVHYSNKGKKYQDTDEILEVAKLAIDGSITKEVKRTRHHEECSEDERPDETGEAEALREAPTVTRSSRRHVDYVNDFDDLATPSCSSDDEQEVTGSRNKHRTSSANKSSTLGGHKSSKRHGREDEAFPRYEIDPLLNSLRDEDFRPLSAASNASGERSRHAKQHKLERKNHSDSMSDSDQEQHHSKTARIVSQHNLSKTRPRSPSYSPARTPVEVPEEYRVNKQRLLGSKGHSRERSFSPTGSKHHQTHAMSRSDIKGPNTLRREDAGVQAHLTDEEDIERKSMRSTSSGGLNSHQRTAQHLQRQSTANSSRRYYYGDGTHKSSAKPSSRRRGSSLSSDSSSLSDPKERARKQGVKSRDSGYKESSRHITRTETPLSQYSNNQIYSVSSKSKKNRTPTGRDDFGRSRGVVSPAPSVGQRSVKTTTTTLSAGLEDRPLSRQDKSSSSSKLDKRTHGETKKLHSRSRNHYAIPEAQHFASYCNEVPPRDSRYEQRLKEDLKTRRPSLDSLSISSLVPSATTIKVPYRQHAYTEMYVKTPKSNTFKRRQRDPDQLTDSKNTQTSPICLSKENLTEDEVVHKVVPHFDHRTVVANLKPSSPKPQVVEAYNVRTIKHDSPFTSQLKPISSILDLSSSIARLELLSSELSSSKLKTNLDATKNTQLESQGAHDGNNNPELVVDQAKFVKVDNDRLTERDTDEVSTVSSSSLRSSKTYDIKNTSLLHHDFDDESHFPVNKLDLDGKDRESVKNENTQTDDEEHPTAWIFDLKDETSTPIKAPPKPPKPELPKVDAKELARSHGGESYYLELVEKGNNSSGRHRPSSIDSLYSRSNSHSTLSGSNNAPSSSSMQRKPLAKSSVQLSLPVQDRRSRLPRQPSNSTNQRARSSSAMRQHDSGRLSSSNSQLAARSKSTFCLPTSTRPTKYSIYGGFKKPEDTNKPVPRLSYSRAIGPKSQRQLNTQSKTPSRYLKMR